MEWIQALAITSLLFGTAYGQSGAERPLWSRHVPQLNTDEINLKALSVDFLSASRIAVSAADRECGRIRVVVLSIGEDTTERHDWACMGRDAQVIALDEGEAILFTGYSLMRLSVAQDLLQFVSVPTSQFTELYLSPNRKLLLLKQFVRGGEFRQTVFDTNNLHRSHELNWNGRDTQGISDSGEALVLTRNKSTSIKLSQTVSLCESEKDCKPVYPNATMWATLVNRDSVLVEIGIHTWRLVRRKGTLARTYNFEPSGAVGRVASASDRFAFVTGYVGSRWSQWVYQVHVANIDDGMEILKLEFRQPIVGAVSRSPAVSVAISPDGSKLAVLRDSLLEVYSIH